MKTSNKTVTKSTVLGRPPKNVSFPKGEFTVKAVFNRLARFPKAKISKVALTKKLRKMEAEGLVEEVGTRSNGSKGRPQFYFKLTAKGLATKTVKTSKKVAVAA